LVAFSPGLIAYSALLMTEPLAALGILTSAWLFVRAIADGTASTSPPASTRQRLFGALAAGAVLGASTLVRPQSLLCAPAFVLLALKRAPNASWAARARAASLQALAVLAVALAVIAPWTLRNCRVMDGCAFVSTNTGWNLAIGAFPRATGRFETLRATDGCPVVTGQVQQDRCWMRVGFAAIAAEPRRWIGLIPVKLSYTFDHESFAMGYLAEADPDAWPEAAKQCGRDFFSAVHRLILCLATLSVAGWPFARRMRLSERFVQGLIVAVVMVLATRAIFEVHHPAWWLAVFMPVVAALPLPGAPRRDGVLGYLYFGIAGVVATHAAFFGEDRYHMVVTPTFCILAACALRPSDAPAVERASRLRT
jgi:hypothetical protein